MNNNEDKTVLDAIDTVCLNCIEDTLTDNSCCDNCPVRKLADSLNNKIYWYEVCFYPDESFSYAIKTEIKPSDMNKEKALNILGEEVREKYAQDFNRIVQISDYEAKKFFDIERLNTIVIDDNGIYYTDKNMIPERETGYTYPTNEEIKNAIDNGWSIEDARRGFAIFNYDGLGLLEIETIGDAHFITDIDDELSAREAEKIGFCKIIPVNELPNNFYYDGYDMRWFGWVDTPENRKNIEEYCRKYCS